MWEPQFLIRDRTNIRQHLHLRVLARTLWSPSRQEWLSGYRPSSEAGLQYEPQRVIAQIPHRLYGKVCDAH